MPLNQVSEETREFGSRGEPEPEKDELMALCGSIKPMVRGVTVEAMNEAIRDAAAGK